MWGGKLHDALLPYLAATAPDILCLQEVIHSPSSEKDWLTIVMRSHPAATRQPVSRCCGCTAMACSDLLPRCARGTLGWRGFNSIAVGPRDICSSFFPDHRTGAGLRSQGLFPVGYGDHRVRAAHMVFGSGTMTQPTLSVTHMHGLRDLNGKMDTPVRAEQARRLLDMSRGLTKPAISRWSAAIFNVEPDSETLSILGSAGLTELVTGTASTAHALTIHEPGRFADYMLIDIKRGSEELRSHLRSEVSDHCPLVLVI